MNEIIDIDVENRIAVVQPGVGQRPAAPRGGREGLYYPPDPGSWEQSTIGGNVSTDAGGMCCVKYGRDQRPRHRLEVVLAAARSSRAAGAPRRASPATT